MVEMPRREGGGGLSWLVKSLGYLLKAKKPYLIESIRSPS